MNRIALGWQVVHIKKMIAKGTIGKSRNLLLYKTRIYFEENLLIDTL